MLGRDLPDVPSPLAIQTDPNRKCLGERLPPALRIRAVQRGKGSPASGERRGSGGSASTSRRSTSTSTRRRGRTRSSGTRSRVYDGRGWYRFVAVEQGFRGALVAVRIDSLFLIRETSWETRFPTPTEDSTAREAHRAVVPVGSSDLKRPALRARRRSVGPAMYMRCDLHAERRGADDRRLTGRPSVIQRVPIDCFAPGAAAPGEGVAPWFAIESRL